MKLVRNIPVVVGVAVAAWAGSANAAIVFNQMPTDQQASLNSQFLSGAGMTRTADDFTLAHGTGGTYTVEWVFGTMITTLGEDTSKYRLEIYNDNAGLPGAVVYAMTGASQALDRGLHFTGMRIIEPRFYVGNWTFAPDTRYWISVIGTAGSSGQAKFASSNWWGTANGSIGMYKVGTGPWTPANVASNAGLRDFAFRLDGTQALPTPAPGALALIGLGGLVASRRRR